VRLCVYCIVCITVLSMKDERCSLESFNTHTHTHTVMLHGYAICLCHVWSCQLCQIQLRHMVTLHTELRHSLVTPPRHSSRHCRVKSITPSPTVTHRHSHSHPHCHPHRHPHRQPQRHPPSLTPSPTPSPTEPWKFCL